MVLCLLVLAARVSALGNYIPLICSVGEITDCPAPLSSVPPGPATSWGSLPALWRLKVLWGRGSGARDGSQCLSLLSREASPSIDCSSRCTHLGSPSLFTRWFRDVCFTSIPQFPLRLGLPTPVNKFLDRLSLLNFPFSLSQPPINFFHLSHK